MLHFRRMKRKTEKMKKKMKERMKERNRKDEGKEVTIENIGIRKRKEMRKNKSDEEE